jgi:hypothetical protein
MEGKMSKRRKLISPTLSNVPVVPVTIRNTNIPQTKAEFLAEEARKAQEAEARRQEEALRPIRKLEQELNDKVLAERDRQRKWMFISSSDYLTEHCIHAPARVESTAEKITAQIRDAFNEFRLDLEQKGVKLHQSAMEKFRQVAEQNPTVDLRIVSNWLILYSHMDEYGVFTDADRTVKQEQPKKPAQPTPQPTLADIEALPDTVEGRKKAKEVVEGLIYEQAGPTFQRWLTDLSERFGFIPTENDRRFILDDLFPRNNWSYIDPRNYDRARRAMVAQHRWPESLLTLDEQLCISLEQGPAIGTLGFDERRGLLTAVKRMRDPN